MDTRGTGASSPSIPNLNSQSGNADNSLQRNGLHDGDGHNNAESQNDEEIAETSLNAQSTIQSNEDSSRNEMKSDTSHNSWWMSRLSPSK